MRARQDAGQGRTRDPPEQVARHGEVDEGHAHVDDGDLGAGHTGDARAGARIGAGGDENFPPHIRRKERIEVEGVHRDVVAANRAGRDVGAGAGPEFDGGRRRIANRPQLPAVIRVAFQLARLIIRMEQIEHIQRGDGLDLEQIRGRIGRGDFHGIAPEILEPRVVLVEAEVETPRFDHIGTRRGRFQTQQAHTAITRGLDITSILGARPAGHPALRHDEVVVQTLAGRRIFGQIDAPHEAGAPLAGAETVNEMEETRHSADLGKART